LVKITLLLLILWGWVLGTLHPAFGEDMNRQEIRARLEGHLRYLSVTLGDRSIFRPENLKQAEDYVFQALTEMGYTPRRQTFIYQRQEVSNVIAGDQAPEGYYILGAHFDTVAGTPGADDNASGVAVLLEVARLAREKNQPRPWTFIGFTTEEPPAFFTPYMGSRVYAKRARKNREKILGMLCLEMVGYYRQEKGSQELPFPLGLMGYPTTGNFLGLISDRRSKPFMERLEKAIKAGCHLPTVTLAVPLGGYILPEVRLSDHANFWDEGFPAVMLTDTAYLRNPHYHGPGDVMRNLDLEAMTEVVLGLVNFVGNEGK
jgi:Zn-dependent M28 family amino/carboxypeptidase